MLEKTQDVARIKDDIVIAGERDFTLFLSVWTQIWFSYKTFFQVLSAPSRVMRIKYSALLALPCFTREVQHLRGRQLGNTAVARKEVMEILSLGIQKTYRHRTASGLSLVRDSWEKNWIGERLCRSESRMKWWERQWLLRSSHRDKGLRHWIPGPCKGGQKVEMEQS